MRRELKNSYSYAIDSVGLNEALKPFNLHRGRFVNKRSKIVYYTGGWDDTTGKVVLLQDTGRFGGVGHRNVKPTILAKNYYQEDY